MYHLYGQNVIRPTQWGWLTSVTGNTRVITYGTFYHYRCVCVRVCVCMCVRACVCVCGLYSI